MRRSSRNSWFLLSGIIGISAIGWLMNTFSPTNGVVLLIFFLFVFATSTSLSFYAFNNVRRAFLVSIGVSIFLALRMIGLKSGIYPLLLIASLASLELFFEKR